MRMCLRARSHCTAQRGRERIVPEQQINADFLLCATLMKRAILLQCDLHVIGKSNFSQNTVRSSWRQIGHCCTWRCTRASWIMRVECITRSSTRWHCSSGACHQQLCFQLESRSLQYLLSLVQVPALSIAVVQANSAEAEPILHDNFQQRCLNLINRSGRLGAG